MHKTIALTVAVTLAALIPASHATAAGPELLLKEHYSADGFHVDHYVTRDADGVLSEATLTDPTTGETADVWSDGETLWWDGTIAGEPISGWASATEVGTDPQAFCFTPISAVVCLGVVVLAAASCAHGSWCIRDEGTEVPGDPGGVPPGDGGGGGDGDGDSGQSGGGDDED